MLSASKPTRKLSDAVIKDTPVDPTKVVKLNAGNGLLLVLMPTGAKLWRTRYRLKKGTDKTFSHGAWGERGDGLSLRDARLAHETVLALARSGTDPVEHRKQQETERETEHQLADDSSFRSVASRWFEYAKTKWKPVHERDVKRRLDANLCPVLGAFPIADIKASQLRGVVRAIEIKEGKPELAVKVLGVAKQVWQYAIEELEICERNVARDVTRPKHKSRQQPAVREQEIGLLLVKIDRSKAERRTKLGLFLLALTMVRTGELLQAKWNEIDFENAAWSIPEERMKAGVRHIVPLSRQALAAFTELKELAGNSRYVLPGRNSNACMSANTLLFCLYALEYKGRMTGHGFRAVGSTMLNESQKFSPDLIEIQLAHTPRDKVRAAYYRRAPDTLLQPRREMLQYLADRIDELKLKGVAEFQADARAKLNEAMIAFPKNNTESRTQQHAA